MTRLPRYTSGQREYEVELQYTSSLLGSFLHVLCVLCVCFVLCALCALCMLCVCVCVCVCVCALCMLCVVCVCICARCVSRLLTECHRIATGHPERPAPEQLSPEDEMVAAIKHMCVCCLPMWWCCAHERLRGEGIRSRGSKCVCVCAWGGVREYFNTTVTRPCNQMCPAES